MPSGLVIYETTHHETLPALLDLASMYFENITVFLREITYQNICSIRPEDKWPKAVFFRQAETVSNRAFIREAVQFAGNGGYTHFHISTLDNNLLYFAVALHRLRRLHISLSVQAVHGYKSCQYRSLRDVTESLAKMVFHRRIRHYRVFFPGMKEVFLQQFPRNHCHFIPSRFFSGKPDSAGGNADFLKLIIPGSISASRRNYAFVVDFTRDYLLEIAAKSAIELVLLGDINTAYGLKLRNELKAYETDRLHIRYYQGYVSQSEYEQQLAAADIIWSPVNINTKSIRGIAETYGISMATGLVADLLFICRPALVPEGFAIPEHYQESLITYDSPSALARRLTELIDDLDENRSIRIFNALSFFSKENFKKEFEELMDIRQ